MLPMVMLALMCKSGGSPQTQIPKALTKPVASQELNIFSSYHSSTPKITLNKAVLNTAEKQIGLKYVWGGTSRSGFDCSGFITYVFAKHNIKLPRTAIEQWRAGKSVSFSNWIPGDLIFFNTRNSRVGHVGIYKGDNKFIHASSGGGKIRINKLEGYYANRYVGARRILGVI